jgi:hypothetical protein
MPSGGAREGAGRKPTPRAAVQIRLHPEDYEALKEAAAAAGKIILAHLYATR